MRNFTFRRIKLVQFFAKKLRILFPIFKKGQAPPSRSFHLNCFLLEAACMYVFPSKYAHFKNPSSIFFAQNYIQITIGSKCIKSNASVSGRTAQKYTLKKYKQCLRLSYTTWLMIYVLITQMMNRFQFILLSLQVMQWK